MHLDSPEFFVNVKSVPDKESSEYVAFWEAEDKKITEGITINGFYFSPFVYWHLNYWSIYVDTMIGKRQVRKLDRPQLWDTYLAVDETIHKAENHVEGKKGVVMVGSRRISKSVLTSSYITHKAVTQRGSDNLISALNGPDIRNFDEGNNTEAAAGLTLSSFLLEEGGKGKILNCLAATTPCFDSPFGWRCSPFVIGTSGDMTKAGDLEELFNNPEAYNFLAVESLDSGKSYGLFIAGTKSLKVPKEPKSLGLYLEKDTSSELDDITIWVSDEAKGKELILKSREQIKKSRNF